MDTVSLHWNYCPSHGQELHLGVELVLHMQNLDRLWLRVNFRSHKNHEGHVSESEEFVLCQVQYIQPF